MLYRGQVMEQGPAAAVYGRPARPYTRALIRAVPEADPRVQAGRRTAAAAGQAAPAQAAAAVSAAADSRGCPFASRCLYVIADCREARPPLRPAPGGTEVACIRADEIPAGEPGVLLVGHPAPSRNEVQT